MSLWTPEEFNRSAASTRLSDRTLVACQDVLVNGMSGVDAAERNNVLPAQISRGLATLREKREQYLSTLKDRQSAKDILKASVIQYAREMAGENLVVKDAQPGLQYEGRAVVKLDGFLVQRNGRNATVHDLGKLDAVPRLDTYLVITYPETEGLAAVEEKNEAALEREHLRRATDSGKTGVER
jgi:hypothetical protein